MRDTLQPTEAWCGLCQRTHPAFYERDEGRMFFRIECDRDPRRTLVSSDADMFLRFRRSSEGEIVARDAVAPQRIFYLLELTDRCGLACPVCYAASGAEGRYFLGPDEAVRRLERIRADGGRWVTLTGGEPTEHPGLTEIVSAARLRGLSPVLATNGLRLAEDPSLAVSLKQAGLKKVQLQWDTFDARVSTVLRGRDLIADKTRALRNVVSAGLRVGLVTTVSAANLAECPEILRFALRHAPALNTVMLQCLLKVGRYPAALGTVTREDIVRTLGSDRSTVTFAGTGAFLPFPVYRPWRQVVHPDCGVVATIGAARGEGVPADAWLDRVRFLRLLGRFAATQRGFLTTVLWPCIALLASIRRPALLRALLGFVTGRGRFGFVMLAVGAYMDRNTCDTRRLATCGSCMVTANGFEGVCVRSTRETVRPRMEAYGSTP